MSYDNSFSLKISGTANKNVVIAELRKFSEECNWLISESGGSNESGSGYKINDDIKEFSKNYPSLIFQLDIDWDSGFGDPPSRYYFKNGVKQDAAAKVVYNEPKFD